MRLLQNLRVALRTLKFHWQDNGWGIKWVWDTRQMFLFDDYMGWHNLSEGHRRDQCDDPAYCQWHGNL